MLQPWSTTLVSLNNLHTETADDYRFSNLITYSHGEGWGGIIPGDESGQEHPLVVMIPGQLKPFSPTALWFPDRATGSS